jgi:hypothetical protein
MNGRLGGPENRSIRFGQGRPHNIAVEAQRARRDKVILMLNHRARLWWVISAMPLPKRFGEERNL